jgi:phage gpG-like protein
MLRAVQGAIGGVFTRREIEELVLQNIRRRFTVLREQKDPETGAPWAPLGRSTRGQRKRNKTGTKILVDTGSLSRSIRIFRARMSDALVRRRGLSIIGVQDRQSGSSPNFNVKEIARIHQFGFRRIPKRPFLGVSKKEGRQIERLFDVRISAAVARTPGVRGRP